MFKFWIFYHVVLILCRAPFDTSLWLMGLPCLNKDSPSWLDLFVSNVSFRHDLIVCLSKAIRDAVIQEKEHSISDKCRKQLRVEKEEEASQIWFLGGPGIRVFATHGEWERGVALDKPMNLIVEKTLLWTSIPHLGHSRDNLSFLLPSTLTVWGTWPDVVFKLPSRSWS